jgi:hypothetical protein
MKNVVAVFRPHIGKGHKRRAAGTGAGWLAMKPVQEKPVQQPDVASRHMRFDLMTSIWCGAMVGYRRGGHTAVLGKRTMRESG